MEVIYLFSNIQKLEKQLVENVQKNLDNNVKFNSKQT